MDARVLTGRIGLRAGILKGDWVVTATGNEVATISLRSRQSEALVRLADGTDWRLTSDGWGLLRAIEAGVPFVRATRDRPAADQWHITGAGIDYRLVPSGMRRWDLVRPDGERAGTARHAITPRSVSVECAAPIPAVVVLLVWMAIVSGARPRLGPEERPAKQRQEPSPDGAL